MKDEARDAKSRSATDGPEHLTSTPRLPYVSQMGVRGGRDTRAADRSRVRRVQALLCTAPVHELQASRNQRGGLWTELDCYELVLDAIDNVVDRMGFDVGCDQGELEAYLATAVCDQLNSAEPRQADEIAHAIVEVLIRPRQGVYTDDRRRPFDFALLREHPGIDGAYLVATNEAINVLVGALDTDVASAQAAAEAQLENLLKRNRFAEAAAVANDARIRSIQYGADVRRVIAETRRDVRRVGWSGEVPKRLSEILKHIEERLDLEQRMLASLRDHRDNAAQEDLSRQASDLIEVVGDCMNRHRELHNLVLEAEKAFYVEQHRQAFLPSVFLRGVDLLDELLSPLLAAGLGQAAHPLAAFAEAAWGTGTPRLTRLTNLYSMLLADSREIGDGVPLPDHDLDGDADDLRRFTREAWASAQSILEDGGAAPRRLSELLVAARATGVRDADELVALLALRAFDPVFENPRPGEVVIASFDDGAILADPQWAGADLLVGALTIDGVRARTGANPRREEPS